MLWSEPVSLRQALHVGLACARQRVDSAVAGTPLELGEVLTDVSQEGGRAMMEV